MKHFHVKQDTPCRLVDTYKQMESPFTTTKDNTFDSKDLVFDPVSWLKDHGQVINEYGFRSGDVQQRARYILVVPMVHVEVTK